MYGCQLHRFVYLILLSMSVYVRMSVASSNICFVCLLLITLSVYVHLSVASPNICFMCLLLMSLSMYVWMSVASFCVSNIAVNVYVRTDVCYIVKFLFCGLILLSMPVYV